MYLYILFLYNYPSLRLLSKLGFKMKRLDIS